MLQQDKLRALSNPFGQEQLTPWLGSYYTTRAENELVYTTTTKILYFIRVLKIKYKISIISNMNILWLGFWGFCWVFSSFLHTNTKIFSILHKNLLLISTDHAWYMHTCSKIKIIPQGQFKISYCAVGYLFFIWHNSSYAIIMLNKSTVSCQNTPSILKTHAQS